MEEIWKDIEGYEGLYQVSSLGMVKSIRFKREKIISQRIRGKGYYAVTLCKNKKEKHFYVHRLVAEAFIPNPCNLPQVNHKSEVKTENFVENLEWCDTKYNINYGTRNNRSRTTQLKRNRTRTTPLIRKRSRTAQLRGKKIYQYTIDGSFIKCWNSSKEIQKTLGYYYKSIQKCCRGIYKQSHGYKWYYEKIEAA